MRILITGHRGFLGSRLYNALKADESHQVHGLDCDFDYDRFEEKFKEFRRYGGYFDLILHCGAIADSNDTSNLLWLLNYKATTAFADYCRDVNTKLIFISSGAAIEPSVPYGWSKQCAEFYINAKVPGMNAVILRPFNIWDYNEVGKKSPSIVYKILTGRLSAVYSRCTRDFIHVSDVVTAVCHIISQWCPGTHAIGTAEPTNIATLVDDLYQNSTCTFPRPPVVAECPVKEYAVARKEDLLPDWKPKTLKCHFQKMCEFMDLDVGMPDIEDCIERNEKTPVWSARGES